ncbi:thermonuclease family protein [Agrobacterium pusense]|uniref:thermonuclease family protein n=1 Tax=Agrobacterium pusense TaxID=648995 RepID=UPI00289C115B|nr:thermonuclease family protein [Agrobacterium pusense]
MLFRFLMRLIFRPRRRRPTRHVPVVIVNAPEPIHQAPVILQGRCWVVDGDTIVIDKTHIRIAGIDAPELDHPFGKQSKWALVQLCKGQTVTAHIRPELSYDRVVAECYLSDGRDLAAELVRAGMALDWPKFSGGKYRHLETSDARRKLWRADARQKGTLRS